MPLEPDHIIALATGGLVEVCLLLLLALVVAQVRAGRAAARRRELRELREQQPAVVVGVVVDQGA